MSAKSSASFAFLYRDSNLSFLWFIMLQKLLQYCRFILQLFQNFLPIARCHSNLPLCLIWMTGNFIFTFILSYSNSVWNFSSINLIISSFVIICLLGIFPFFIFFNLTLFPALAKTTVTSNPIIPISL